MLSVVAASFAGYLPIMVNACTPNEMSAVPRTRCLWYLYKITFVSASPCAINSRSQLHLSTLCDRLFSPAGQTSSAIFGLEAAMGDICRKMYEVLSCSVQK